MSDNVGEDFAEAVFLAPKLYALRGVTSGKTKVKAKGLPGWLTSDSDTAAKRREQNGQRQIGFDDLVSCLRGEAIEFSVLQQTIAKKELKNDDVINIKQERFTNKAICGVLNKRILA